MKKFIVIALILLGLIISCSEDDETIVSVSDFEITIDENPNPNQVIGTIKASTNQGNLTFSIKEQSPNNAFKINVSTGELTVFTESLFDFETHPTITGILVAENGNVSESANITINLNDIEETTITISDFEVNIDENPKENQILGTIDATTNRGNLEFSIINQSPEDAILINSSTGELSVLTPSLFDFETHPIITANIVVENKDIMKTVDVTVNLEDIIKPTNNISNFNINMDENPNKNQVIGIVNANTDRGNLRFTIINQYPSDAFQINSCTGELTVLNEKVFDYELHKKITGQVYAINEYFVSSIVTINLNDLQDTFITIEDFEVTLDENPQKNQVLGKVNASINSGHLTFSTLNQSPENAFQINPSTGELTVLTESLFDYEIHPIITGTVVAKNGNTEETATVTINLNDLDDSTITISDFEVIIDENPIQNQILGTIDASVNKGNLTFSILEQSPINAFQINSSTGELTVLNRYLFDFENHPTITGIIKAETGNVSKIAKITINLNDVVENIIEITNIFDTNIEGLANVPSYNTLPNINFTNFEDSPLIIANSYETTHQGDIACFATRGLLDFDLASIPNNINIIRVQLVLQKNNVIYCPPCGPYDNQNTQLLFQLINSGWDVSTVNWDNQPSTNINQSSNLHILDIENINSFDITNLFLELYSNQTVYKGIMLKITESCIQESVSFFSSNYSDTSKRPKIIIQYD